MLALSQDLHKSPRYPLNFGDAESDFSRIGGQAKIKFNRASLVSVNPRLKEIYISIPPMCAESDDCR